MENITVDPKAGTLNHTVGVGVEGVALCKSTEGT